MPKSMTWIGSILVDALFEVNGRTEWEYLTNRFYRTCRHYLNPVLCYTFLEQRHEASVVPSARGVPVSTTVLSCSR